MKPTARDCSDDCLVLARRGALSWSAWNDLATHLATCPDCRIDWQLSADFDGSAGAVPGDERMIARAADAATARMPLGLVRVAVAAGALLAVAGVASGAIVLHARYVGGSAAAGVGVRRGAGGNGSGAAHASDAASRSVVRADEPPPSGPPRSQPGSIPEDQALTPTVGSGILALRGPDARGRGNGAAPAHGARAALWAGGGRAQSRPAG